MTRFMASCVLPALLFLFILFVLTGIACVAAAILTANGAVLWR